MGYILSICYPSYNRGEKCLEKVEELLAATECREVQIVVSNNGSTKETEAYQKISEISDERLKYYQFLSNHEAWGNIHQVIRMAEGHFCLLVSDEDHVAVENLHMYISYLKDHISDLALMKGGVVGYEPYIHDKFIYYQSGVEAVKNYYLYNNYLSGTIYNKRYASEELLVEMEETYVKTDNIAYFHYPHMMLDAELMLQGGFAWGEGILIRPGEPDKESNEAWRDVTCTYASVGNRVIQMEAFIKQIENIQAYDSVKICMFRTLIDKTIYLQKMIRRSYYEKQGADWYSAVVKSCSDMKRIVKNVQIPIIYRNREEFINYIDQLWSFYLQI